MLFECCACQEKASKNSYNKLIKSFIALSLHYHCTSWDTGTLKLYPFLQQKALNYPKLNMQAWEISINENTLILHPYPLQVAPISKVAHMHYSLS